jgi:hypothetical protein
VVEYLQEKYEFLKSSLAKSQVLAKTDAGDWRPRASRWAVGRWINLRFLSRRAPGWLGNSAWWLRNMISEKLANLGDRERRAKSRN